MRPRISQFHQSGATDGQSPVWDEAAGLWVPGDSGGGASLTISAAPPEDTATPSAWADVTIGGVLYQIPLYLPAVFTPDDIAGLQAWYDASELALAEGAAVAQWDDLSGNAYHLTQATAAKQPTLNTLASGVRAVVFDGVDDMLADTFPATLGVRTMFVVANQRSGTGDVLLDGVDSTNRGVLGAVVSTADDWGLWTPGGHQTVYNARPTGYAVFAVRIDGASTTIRRDGAVLTPVSSAGTPSTPANIAGLTMGARYSDERHATADISEVLYYNTALTTAEVEQVEAYLIDKWL